MIDRRALGVGLLLLTAVVAATPSGASAQAGEEITRERMIDFTRAHLAMNDARDEFHGEVARVHDAEGRLRARQAVEARITEILSEHGLTREEFDHITLLISLDGELRAVFDELLVELAEEGARPG